MDFKKLFTEKDINKHKVIEENIKKIQKITLIHLMRMM